MTENLAVWSVRLLNWWVEAFGREGKNLTHLEREVAPFSPTGCESCSGQEEEEEREREREEREREERERERERITPALMGGLIPLLHERGVLYGMFTISLHKEILYYHVSQRDSLLSQEILSHKRFSLSLSLLSLSLSLLFSHLSSYYPLSLLVSCLVSVILPLSCLFFS